MIACGQVKRLLRYLVSGSVEAKSVISYYGTI